MALVLGASAMFAGAPALAAAECAPTQSTMPFARFLDPSKYSPVPGGSFEPGGEAWQLARSTIVAENESFDVAGGSSSLRIAAGGAALSPPFCIDIAEPTFRFFVRHEPEGPGLLRVALRWQDERGVSHESALGSVAATTAWTPSPVLLLDLALPTALLESAFGSLSGALSFEAPQGSGAWQLDDVYFDPYRR